MTERLSVAIFGSANVTGTNDYQAQIEALGGELAKKDLDIFVGSTTGLIGRFLEGVHKAQKVSIVNLVAYGDQRYMSDQHIDNLILKECYFTRLSVLCECEVFIVLDGQLGTMAETMVTWNRLQANKEFDRKIIIFGDIESIKIKFLLNNFVFSKQAYRELVYFAKDVEEVMKMTDKMLALHE
ncbi:MAG: hypothetical protein HRT35_14585 [Algicola sp.]|nr:hypothetical protein [Algicola sp.]